MRNRRRLRSSARARRRSAGDFSLNSRGRARLRKASQRNIPAGIAISAIRIKIE
ncbi:MAG: hypothetical protein ACE5LQ_03245 [Candidatus Bipolaricaulia bacterium]